MNRSIQSQTALLIAVIVFSMICSPVLGSVGSIGTSFATHTQLGLEGTSGYLSSGSNFFAFSTVLGQSFTLTLNGQSGTDFDLYLYDTYGGSPVASSVKATYPDEITYTSSGGGYYYVEARRYSGAGWYVLDWSQSPARGTSFSNAMYFMEGGSSHGLEAKTSGSDHYYKSDWSAGQVLRAAIVGESGTDFDLYIYDSGYNQIASATGVSYPDAAAFTTSWPTYIKVHPFSGTGEYRLEVHRPTITDWYISSTTVEAGKSFTAYYYIKNPFSHDISVWLGCSIRKGGTVIDDPDDDVQVSVPPGEYWRNRNFDVPGDASPGDYEVVLAIWDRKVAGSMLYQYHSTGWQPGPTITAPPGIARVIVNPNGGRIYVDGSSITSSTDYDWVVGSSHTLNPDSGYTPSTGRRLIFTQWSDGNTADPRSITVTGPATYTAEWRTQYRLIISVSPSGGGTTSPSAGTYWHDSGTSAPVSETPNTGYEFDHWDLDGSNVGSGTSYTVNMNSPHTLTAIFNPVTPTQYYLTVQSNYGTTGGEGWYDKGDTTYAQIVNTQGSIDGPMIPLPEGAPWEEVTAIAFLTGWSGDAQGPGWPSASPTSDPIIMDGPKTAIADWHLHGGPIAGFTASAYTEPAPATIDFDPSSTTGLFLTFEWDLDGDGLFEIFEVEYNTVSHTYTVPGIYTVTLRVTDLYGLIDTAEAEIIIDEGQNNIALSSRTDDSNPDIGKIIFKGITEPDGEDKEYTLPTSIPRKSASYIVWARLEGSGCEDSYEFLRWETSGDVSADPTNLPETFVTIEGDGQLTAVWKLRVLQISKILPDGATYRPGSAVTLACKVTDDSSNAVTGCSVLAFVTAPSETAPQTVVLSDLNNGEYAYHWKIPDSGEAGTYSVSFQASVTRYTAYLNDYFIADTGTGHIASDAWIGNVPEGKSVYFDFFIPYQDTTMPYYLDVVMRSSDVDYLVLNLIDSEGNHIPASGTNPQRITLQNQWGSFRIQIYGSSIHGNGGFYVGYMYEYGYNRIFEVSEMQKDAAEYLLQETKELIIKEIYTNLILPQPYGLVLSLALNSYDLALHIINLKDASKGRCLTVWSETTDGNYFVGTVIMDGMVFDLTTEVASKTIHRLQEENYRIYLEAQDFLGYTFDHWEAGIGDPSIELIYSRNTWIGLTDATSGVKAVYQPVETGESQLKIRAHSPLNLMVTDPSGSRVGYDPNTGEVVNEIEGATYSGPGTDPQVIAIPAPLTGVYIIDTFGTGTGAYTITVESKAADGTTTDTETWTGTTSPGELSRGSAQLFEDGSLASMPHGVIPEVPLGTIVASAAMIIALVAYVTMPKWRRKRRDFNN